MNISALHIANIFDYASYQGIDETYLRSLLNKGNIDLCDPMNTVSKEEFTTIFKVIISKSKSPNFGLHYGCYLNIKALSFISQISLNVTSIEQAVLLLQQYLLSSFPLVSLSVSNTSKHYSLLLNCTVNDKDVKKHLLDSTYCFIYRELKLMLSDDFTPQLQLPYEDIREYSLQLNTDVQRGDQHRILLNKNVLKTEINRKKVKEIECLLPQFLTMLDSTKSTYQDFSLQIRNMTLSMCCPEIPTFEQVSKQFALSDRSIQRKLNNEGQSFRKISDRIKQELSYYLTAGKLMKTQDIAYILGYSESSAYLHAAKRWETNAEL